MVVVRWVARILSALIVLFFGFFLVADLIGDHGHASRPLVWRDYVILVTLVISLVGLLLAWKWELVGAVVTLVAILICALMNWRIMASPGALIPITAVLYLLSHFGPRRRRISSAQTFQSAKVGGGGIMS
jgi:hypothetical protein